MHVKSAKDLTSEVIIKRYTAIEGGYVNDPNDLGGETNHGITKGLANEYKSQLVANFKWDGTMRNLSKEMALFLYRVAFWDKIYGDRLMGYSAVLADKLFDISINAGRARSATWLQEYLNAMNNEQKLYPDLKVDGGFGPTTLGRLEDYLKARGKPGMARLIHGMIARQTHHYVDISLARVQNERFTYGWINRAFDSAVEYTKWGELY